MKKILVPCDFSPQSINAFRFALEVATRSNGEVHLVHIIELPVMHDPIFMPVFSFKETFLKELMGKAEQRFKEIKKKYVTKKHTVTTSVIFGGTSQMILHYIDEHRADLVIMGTKGAKGLREFVIGSNTEKIVRHAHVPVIAVKQYIPLKSIRNIVFPNALKNEHEESLIVKLKALQNFLKAKIHILYVNTPSTFTPDHITLDRLKAFAKRYLFKDFTINIYNDPFEEEGVINFTHEIKADMIVMGTHGRKGLVHKFSGSLAEDIMNHVDCPVWTCHINNNMVI